MTFAPRPETKNAASTIIRRAESSSDRDACLRIRFEVFVGEQNVSPEEELDTLDGISTHYLAVEGSDPVGTARLIPKGQIAKIGRFAVVRQARGQGVGLALIRFVMDDAIRAGFTESVLDAQTYAVPFYERAGFVAEGDEFLDAGIPHYRMRRSFAQVPEASALDS